MGELLRRRREAAPVLKAMGKVQDKLQSAQEVFIEQCRARLKEIQETRERITKIPTFVNDPIGFTREILREHPWSKQQQIMEAVRDNRRVAIPSCHDSGKSWLASRVAAWWISCHPPGEAFVVSTAPSNAQVRAILWREINKCHTKGKLPGRTNQTEWFIGSELVGFGRKPDDFSDTAFQGNMRGMCLF